MTDFQYQLFRLAVFLIPWGGQRTRLIIKKKIFAGIGENFYYCPRKLPADPKLIKFGNNVAVATDVTFVNHDVMWRVFNHVSEYEYSKYYGCIEVGNNVFIGARTIILPNIKIGSNIIIAAGAVVTKDLSDGGIYAGNPAHKIGDFYSFMQKRKRYHDLKINNSKDSLWNVFMENHNI